MPEDPQFLEAVKRLDEARADLRLRGAMNQALEGLDLAVLHTPSGAVRNVLAAALLRLREADRLIREHKHRETS